MNQVETKKNLRKQIKDAKRELKSNISKMIEDFKEFKNVLKQAHSVGYNSGKTDYQKLKSKNLLERSSAVRGYGDALSDSAKRDKYTGKLNNVGKKKIT